MFLMKRHSLPCCLLDTSAMEERDCVIAEIWDQWVKFKKYQHCELFLFILIYASEKRNAIKNIEH